MAAARLSPAAEAFLDTNNTAKPANEQWRRIWKFIADSPGDKFGYLSSIRSVGRKEIREWSTKQKDPWKQCREKLTSARAWPDKTPIFAKWKIIRPKGKLSTCDLDSREKSGNCPSNNDPSRSPEATSKKENSCHHRFNAPWELLTSTERIRRWNLVVWQPD